jgi:hypothetical protein
MDCDQSRAEVEIEVALDAPPEADAIAHRSVVAQSSNALGKFSKELVVKPKPMCMSREVFEVGYILLCDLKVESFFALVAVVIKCLVVGLLSVGQHAWQVHPEGKLWDILVLKFLWHHPVNLDVVVGQV